MGKKLITLLLLLLSWSLQAQVTTTNLLKQDSLVAGRGQVLKKGWLIQPADFNGWSIAASPDNNKPWYVLNSIEDLAVIKNKIKQFEGLCWLKCYIKADTGMAGVPLSLSAIHNGASDVFLNNKLISRNGIFSEKNKKGMYITRERPVAFVLSDTGIHELLVKYENKELVHPGKQDKNEFTIKLNTADYTFSRLAMTAKQNIFLIITVIFFSFSLFHFILFLFYRKDLSNLFFSLFNLATGFFFLMVYKAILSSFGGPSSPQDYMKVAIVSIAVSGLALSGLVNKLFDKFGWRFLTIVSLGIVSVILMWFAETVSLILIAITINVTLIEVIFLLLRAFIRKVQGAKILAFGILLDFVFFIILVILMAVTGAIKGGDNSFDDREVSDMILITAISLFAVLAVFCIPLSMSIYLAWKTAYVNKQLGMQIARVEALSLEKQSILEHQKEKLEEEVKARTSELIVQKKKSDDLLLNILPHEIAEELKATGQSKAHQYEEVSVLFTDFVNFTQISERLGVDELLEELNINFTAFDRIMEKHKLEKIKTIGDAYLAVSGLPAANQAHAQNAVLAALDIIQFVSQRRKQVDYGLDIRIGINSGSLIAGIIGVKKFAYDIWGDTVNIAARMEQSSEPGKVNISESTYQLVKEDFDCVHRGKVDAKHKGEMDMYFVTQVNNKK